MDSVLTFFTNVLIEKAYILVPVLLALGVPLKMSAKVPDWIIIYILTGLGILGGFGLMGLSFQAAFQGIVSAAIACLMYQMYRQAIKAKADKDAATAAKTDNITPIDPAAKQ